MFREPGLLSQSGQKHRDVRCGNAGIVPVYPSLADHRDQNPGRIRRSAAKKKTSLPVSIIRCSSLWTNSKRCIECSGTFGKWRGTLRYVFCTLFLEPGVKREPGERRSNGRRSTFEPGFVRLKRLQFPAYPGTCPLIHIPAGGLYPKSYRKRLRCRVNGTEGLLFITTPLVPGYHRQT